MRRGRLCAGACIVACLACGSHSPSTERATSGALDGLVAQVGQVGISSALVVDVAAARAISPRWALDDLVADALAAEGARAAGLDLGPAASWDTTSVLARRVSERFWQQARNDGPPTADELAELTVVHAVVLHTRIVTEAQAIVFAHQFADAVAGARTDEEFLSLAKAAATREVRTTVERVPPFGADGQLDLDFMAAAFALHVPGDTSGIVQTAFGWHVIRLVSRGLPAGVDVEARRIALTRSVQVLRARTQLDRVLLARKARTHVEILPSAEGLMAQAMTARQGPWDRR